MVILLIPNTLAYWTSIHPASSTLPNVSIKVLFDYGPPEGSIDWEEDLEHKYEKDEIIKVEDDDYYVVVDPKLCEQYTNGKCPKPGSPSADNNPYRSLSIDWVPNQYYYQNEIVRYDGNIYILVSSKSNSPQSPPSKVQEEWRLLSHINYDQVHKRYEDTYLKIKEDTVVFLLQTGLWKDINFPTWPYDNQTQLKFTESYDRNKTYTNIIYNGKTISPVVFHNNGIYKTENLTLSNQHEPGTYYGAWNRIDSIQWNDFNTYKKNDVVTHNGFVYQASRDGIRNTPGEISPEWILIMELKYQENVIYKRGHVVLYKNKMYKAQVDILDGTKPGSDESKWK